MPLLLQTIRSVLAVWYVVVAVITAAECVSHCRIARLLGVLFATSPLPRVQSKRPPVTDRSRGHAGLESLDLSEADAVTAYEVLRSTMHSRCRGSLRRISLIPADGAASPWLTTAFCADNTLCLLPMFAGVTSLQLPLTGDARLPDGRLGSILQPLHLCTAVSIVHPPLQPTEERPLDSLQRWHCREQGLTLLEGQLAANVLHQVVLPHVRELELVDFAFVHRPDDDLAPALEPFFRVQTLRLRFIGVPVPRRAWLARMAVVAMGVMPRLRLLEIVREEPGRAAVVELLFPLPQAPAAAAPERSAPRGEGTGGGRGIVGRKRGRCCEMCGVEREEGPGGEQRRLRLSAPAREAA